MPSRDFDLHGLVGVRLVDPTVRDTRAVARQLGTEPVALGRDPDLVIRFVDRIPARGALRYLGRDEAAFDDETFLVLRGKHKARVRVQLPFDQIGRGAVITCERGVPAVPLLVGVLNLTLLGKGVLPLHAAAFVHRGVGVLVTGWSKGGKTEALLAFMANGATYIGDEWVYLTPDGGMHGIPEPIRLWDWHLRSLPSYQPALTRSDRFRVAGLRRVVDGLEAIGQLGDRGGGLRRLQVLLADQLCVDVRPGRLFGPDACGRDAHCDRVFMVMSGEDHRVAVQPIDGLEVARRMAASLQYERRDLMAMYTHFRFAFPDLRSELVETAAEREAELLHKLLGDGDAYLVTHPHPFHVPALFDAMRPLLSPEA